MQYVIGKFPRDGESERRPCTGLIFHPDVPSMSFHGEFAEGQSQAGSLNLLTALSTDVKLKDTFLILRCDAGAGVIDGEVESIVAAGYVKGDAALDWGEFDGVVEQIRQDSPQ